MNLPGFLFFLYIKIQYNFIVESKIEGGLKSIYISNDKLPIFITEFDSTTINTIFGWVSLSLQESSFIHKTNKLISAINIEKFWENVLFEEYTKIFERNIIQLAKAADYFDIQNMSDSLVPFIAKELIGKDSMDIYSMLYDRTIYVPNRFICKVLCVLLSNKIHHNTLHYKQELYGNSEKEMSLVEKFLNRKHFPDNLDIDDFTFLYNTIGNYVKVEDTLEFNSLLSKLQYPNVKIDFGYKKNFRHYIEKYIDEEDRQNTMIAGGIFSKYQKESIFAHFFPDMYDTLKNNQDIDIFIHDNGKKFNKYYDKIFEVFLENPYTKNDRINNIEEESNENYKIYQGINAFKITLLNGDIY